MTHVGRNGRCPCGSDKKYKKCCLPAEQERERATMRAAHERARELEQEVRERNAQRARDACPGVGLDNGVVPFGVDADELDELSNSALDLIRQRRFDEALVACERLLREYPDVHDGFERSALLHDALGNHATAAEFWQKTVDFVEHPDRRDDYDEDLIDEYRLNLTRSRERAQQAAEAKPARVADHDRAP